MSAARSTKARALDRHIAPRIVMRHPATLQPYANNARTHSPRQVRLLEDSIMRFGFTNPILTDGHDAVLAGHGRLRAALNLGLHEVPTIPLGALNDAEKRAYRIADNRLAERAGWDRDLLAIEFDAIVALDSAFDLESTGFDARDVELIIDGGHDAEDTDGDWQPSADAPAVTRLGDPWQLGPHRLVCGDATTRDAYQALLGAERAAMVFTDPPYNVPIAGHVSGKGRVQHREFVQASGEMSEFAFTRFLTAAMSQMRKCSREGSLHFVCMDWRHLFELLSAARAVYDDYKNLCVWAKPNAGMGSLYRSQHELIAVFKVGDVAHTNNVELGGNGRHRSNLWSYAGGSSFSAERDAELAMHPTVKPLAMVADAILDASKRGDIILDPFGGSGTTLIAAERTGRHARLIELDPRYCDTIVRRFEATTGQRAMLTSTGESFAELASSRAAAAAFPTTEAGDA